ncbi:outer membrane putative beta-barrel porin/alpha-amylase [Gelidibacter sediminis]|uniref:Outer membrane putative beta-barrel porin/alpha-amylase n=1 Tax=Gelidibacter sediminis TaxID=1608710 RepID=A0A4R7PY82_9FLAO|nr:transporter [Gelidibacter sediminis]TDU39945.1 outer membrane putative beta-barrel porin/alpha-amylase [Gelidibacter sediminis]
MKSIKISFVFLIFTFTHFAFAQYTEVINSNRPGVSQSAFSVGTNVLQFEAGPYLIKEEHTPLKYEVSGFGADFAARFGLLFEELELNIQGTYQNDTQTYNSSSIPQEFDRGNFKTLAIGAKYMIYDPYRKAGEEKPNLYSWKANRKFKWKSLIPAVAIYAGANYDTKDNPYTAPGIEGFSPKVAIISQNNFSGGWVFVINLVKDRIGTDQSDFQYIFTLTHSFNPQWAIFTEAQGIKSDFYADNLFRFGGAYLWNKNFQLDTALTFNTKDTPSVLGVNFGMSYRFDFHKDKEIDNGNPAKDELRLQERKIQKKKQTDFNDDGK